MLKKIISLALTLILSFQCFPSMSAYSINGGNTEINKLASQIEYEIEEKREENTKYFKLKDEQVLKVEYSTPVHIKNKDGKWEDLYNKERKNTINFSKNSELEKLVQIEREQYGIAWNFEDAVSSPISEINENHKVYKNIYNDVDVDYSILKNKLKETIILNSKSSQKEFTVDYYLENLTPNQTDTKTIELLNKNQKCVYTISAPKMFDSAGKSCENLNFEIVSSEEEKLKVKIICDKSWLEEKERVYPIFVDPDYTDEAFEYNIAMGAKPRELMFNTNWRKKDTNKSIFLNLSGSDFPGMGVVKVQVFGKNSQGEENCTYGTECYFLEAGKKYELYNEVNEKGYSEVQLRFVCLPGNRIRGCWSPDYKEEAGTFTIGAWGSKSKSKRQNSSDEKFDLIIKPDRHCWASFRTKTTNSSIYLALEGLGDQVNVEIWGLGGENFSENCNNRCQQYSLALGKKYELYNIVSERHHTAVRLRFEGEPGTEIKGRWSPDFNDAWEREHNPGWTLIDGSGNDRIVGSSSADSRGTAIRPITNPQALINVPQISQVGKFPTGCESVSAVMVLNFYGCNISVKEFIDKHLVKKRISDHPDPNSAFVGSPYDTHSYGCFAPCIAKAMNKVLKEAHAEVIRGKSLKALSEEYIRNGTPVLIWVTMGMRKTRPTTTWTIGYTDENARYRKGEKFTWPGNEHCVVLIGFNDKDYFVNDPLQALGKVKGAYEKNLLEERFREQGSQAVVVRKTIVSIPDYTSMIQSKLNEEHNNFFKFRGEIIKIPLHPQNVVPILNALFYFFKQVTHRGPWDVKVPEVWNKKFPVQHPGKEGKFKFYSYELTSEDLGNLTYGYLGTALGLHPLTLYVGGGAAHRRKEIVEMMLAVIFRTELYTPPDYGDDHNDHINVERGIQLYKTLFPSLIKSIPIKRLDPPWDQSGLYVLAEYLMVKIRSTCKSKKNLPYRLDDDDAAYERLVSDFTNYLKVYNIIK